MQFLFQALHHRLHEVASGSGLRFSLRFSLRFRPKVQPQVQASGLRPQASGLRLLYIDADRLSPGRDLIGRAGPAHWHVRLYRVRSVQVS